YTAAKTGTRPKHQTKDGSILTHPVVSCPDLPEQGKDGVQDLCYKWLKARRVFCDTHACGRKNGILYGIKHSGDIHGYLPDGRGFEIECKRGKGGHQTKGQRERETAVWVAGGVYYVVHGIPEMECYFKRLV
ncbi:hypothetical protein LCGC14_2867320, partial [marine sediment metagenome]